jgi:diadenosine tetraphosphate (Ap4A) HIT family hydrolase
MSQRYVPDCVFCLKNEKVKPLKETALGYLIQPIGTPQGRYLIIPKEHHVDVRDRHPGWTRHENTLLQEAIEHAKQDERINHLDLEGCFNLNWNQGEFAGQTIDHIHCWVIFRYDDLKLGTDGLIKLIEPSRCPREL